MQGNRGPGLLMGFGKAKLAAPTVRKFAPSLKPQIAKAAVVAPSNEPVVDSQAASDAGTDQQPTISNPVESLVPARNESTVAENVTTEDVTSSIVVGLQDIPVGNSSMKGGVVSNSSGTQNHVTFRECISEAQDSQHIRTESQPITNVVQAKQKVGLFRPKKKAVTVSSVSGSASSEPALGGAETVAVSSAESDTLSSQKDVSNQASPLDSPTEESSANVTHSTASDPSASIAPSKSASLSSTKSSATVGSRNNFDSESEDGNEDHFAAQIKMGKGSKKRAKGAQKAGSKANKKLTTPRSTKSNNSSEALENSGNATEENKIPDTDPESEPKIVSRNLNESKSVPTRRKGRAINVGEEMSRARVRWNNRAGKDDTEISDHDYTEDEGINSRKREVKNVPKKRGRKKASDSDVEESKNKGGDVSDGVETKKVRKVPQYATVDVEEINPLALLDMRFFKQYDCTKERKITKRAAAKMKQKKAVLPASFGIREYECRRAYLHRHPPPTGLGMRLRNIDGKAVVRGFTLPVVISEEEKEADAKRLASRTALYNALQSRSTITSTSSLPPPSSSSSLASFAPPVSKLEDLLSPARTMKEVDENEEDAELPWKDNPAYLAGVRINDVIMSVNNTDATNATFERIIRALMGNSVTSQSTEETVTPTSGLMHPCNNQPSGSRGMSIVAVDHIVCVRFARPLELTATLHPTVIPEIPAVTATARAKPTVNVRAKRAPTAPVKNGRKLPVNSASVVKHVPVSTASGAAVPVTDDATPHTTTPSSSSSSSLLSSSTTAPSRLITPSLSPSSSSSTSIVKPSINTANTRPVTVPTSSSSSTSSSPSSSSPFPSSSSSTFPSSSSSSSSSTIIPHKIRIPISTSRQTSSSQPRITITPVTKNSIESNNIEEIPNATERTEKTQPPDSEPEPLISESEDPGSLPLTNSDKEFGSKIPIRILPVKVRVPFVPTRPKKGPAAR